MPVRASSRGNGMWLIKLPMPKQLDTLRSGIALTLTGT
jgi:hypothetical protein